jgi:hypothetical protein
LCQTFEDDIVSGMMTLKGKKQYLPPMQPVLTWFLLAAVFMLTAAPVVSASLSQNRVGGYHTFFAGRTGVEPGLNAEPHQVYGLFNYDFAPGSPVASKKGYRAVSDAELDDIAEHGFRPHPEGKSMQDKWFSETREGAEKFTKTFPNQKNIVEAEVPKSVYDKSYKHPNIDNTGPGFAVPAEELSKVKPR